MTSFMKLLTVVCTVVFAQLANANSGHGAGAFHSHYAELGVLLLVAILGLVCFLRSRNR